MAKFLPPVSQHWWGPEGDESGINADFRIDLSSSRKAFEGLRLLIRTLGVENGDRHWDRLRAYFADCATGSVDTVDTLRRRLNREPGPAIKAVELSAVLLSDALLARGNLSVAIAGIDNTDTLTIRALARVAIRSGGSSEGPRFVWMSRQDPRLSRVGAQLTNPVTSPGAIARSQLLHRIASTGAFVMGDWDQQVATDFTLQADDRVVCAEETSALRDLMVHNYDAALDCAAFLSQKNEAARSAPLRVLGLAQISVGDYSGASLSFESAIRAEVDPIALAHLRCLLGLLAAKRKDAPGVAEAIFDEGLDALGQSTSPNALVERAWLLNGKALVHALGFRATGDSQAIRRALRLSLDALSLVSGQVDSDSIYLRYNIIANIVLLNEMRGAYPEALTLLESSFANATEGSTRERAVLDYRRGVLSMRAGSTTWQPTRHDQLEVEDWLVSDYCLRISGVWSLARGDIATAHEVFEAGLAIAEKSRSSAAASFHSLALAGGLTSAELLALLPSKLPTNSAEIDFDFEPERSVGGRLEAR